MSALPRRDMRPLPLPIGSMLGRVCLGLLAGLLTACTTPWQSDVPATPTSYASTRGQVPRTVGLLRRLAVVVIEQQPPRACDASTDSAAGIVENAVDLAPLITLLTERKDYEAIALDAARGARWFDDTQRAAWASEITAWLKDTSDNAASGPLTEALVRGPVRSDQFDGLLVLTIEKTCARAMSALRGAIGLFSLGFSEVFVDPKLQEIYRVHRAVIIEAASGRAVWRNSTSNQNDGMRAIFSNRRRSPVEILFDDLEAAVPKLLTR